MLNADDLLLADVIPAALDQQTVVDDENEFEGRSFLSTYAALDYSSTDRFVSIRYQQRRHRWFNIPWIRYYSTGLRLLG